MYSCRAFALFRLTPVLLAAFLISGCDAPPDLVEPTDRLAPAGPSASTLSPEEDIDEGDTYYLADVVQEGSAVVTSDVPIMDPITGVETTEWTVEHETEYQRVEGGMTATAERFRRWCRLMSRVTRCSTRSIRHSVPNRWMT